MPRLRPATEPFACHECGAAVAAGDAMLRYGVLECDGYARTHRVLVRVCAACAALYFESQEHPL